MSFLKTHLPPTLHNAGGTLIAAAVVGLPGCLLFISSFRNFPAPLWVVFILFMAWVAVILLLAKNHKQKAADSEAAIQKEQAEAIAKLQKQHHRDMAAQTDMRNGDLNKKDEEIASLRQQLEDLRNQAPTIHKGRGWKL